MGIPRRNHFLSTQVCQKLASLRESLGYSQEKVYENTRINVGRVEAGEHEVSLTTLGILCHYYHTTLEEFFKGIMVTLPGGEPA